MTATAALEKDQNLLCLVLQCHRSVYSNEMTSFPMLLVAVFLGTERLFLQNRSRERFSAKAVSMLVKFECFVGY